MQDDHSADPLRPRWAELVRLRPEFGAVPVPSALGQHIRLALSRLSADVSAAWRDDLSEGEPQPLAAEAEETEARLKADVTGIIGDQYPRLRDALTGIGVIARHGAGLGRIDLKAGVGGPWLRRFEPEDFGDLWRVLCDLLTRFADDARPLVDRREALIRLDTILRTVVPADFSTSPDMPAPRIQPPEPDSDWDRLLSGCLKDVRAFCEGHGFQVDHAPPDIRVRDAGENYYVDIRQSLRQPRSITAESARAGPRNRTNGATASVASTPATNVGTVRQATHPPSRRPAAYGDGGGVHKMQLPPAACRPASVPACPSCGKCHPGSLLPLLCAGATVPARTDHDAILGVPRGTTAEHRHFRKTSASGA